MNGGLLKVLRCRRIHYYGGKGLVDHNHFSWKQSLSLIRAGQIPGKWEANWRDEGRKYNWVAERAVATWTIQNWAKLTLIKIFYFLHDLDFQRVSTTLYTNENSDFSIGLSCVQSHRRIRIQHPQSHRWYIENFLHFLHCCTQFREVWTWPKRWPLRTDQPHVFRTRFIDFRYNHPENNPTSKFANFSIPIAVLNLNKLSLYKYKGRFTWESLNQLKCDWNRLEWLSYILSTWMKSEPRDGCPDETQSIS